MNKITFLLCCTLSFCLSGCNLQKEPATIKPIASKIEIPKSEKVSKGAINQVATTQKKMALTFNGLADKQTMDKLLKELNRFDIKATFFLQGIRVAEDPDLAKEIIKQGHTIQNNTLNHVLPDRLEYEEAYIELVLANRVFKEHLNIEPKYARTRSGDSSDSFQEAATQLNMEVVTYTINPKDTQMQSAEEIADYIRRFANRGAIIELNTYINPEVIRAISLIYQYASADGYTLTTFEEVHQTNYLVDELIDTNNLAVNTEYENSKPAIIEKFSTTEKEIALTFDDWASDETISAVLDILDDYNVKSTFFLIGKGVETNPQLARLILERGHEVASHSYNHKVITTMDPGALQEDLVKNDQILTHALQEKPLNYFRPAQGVLDEVTAKAIGATGVDYIMLYDVASLDWDLSLSEDEVYNRVVSQVGPGSIVDMHILDESHTVSVLPRIIEHLQQNGYKFKKISEMIPIK